MNRTRKIATIAIMLVLYTGLLFIVHLRWSQVEKERCTAWAWEVCKDLNK
jgi:hypothetical protein